MNSRVTMVDCLRCDSSFEPRKGYVRFCSPKCRYGRVWGDEVNKERSKKASFRWASLSESERAEWVASRSKFHTVESIAKTRERAKQRFDARPWDDLGDDGRRRRVLEEQKGCCNRCKRSTWFDEPLVIEIDHKDGCRDNNQRENLEGLCPNCHSLTVTWRGRNKPSRNGFATVTDEQMKQALISTPNVRQALLMLGLAAKGGNYKRAKKIQQEIIGP